MLHGALLVHFYSFHDRQHTHTHKEVHFIGCGSVRNRVAQKSSPQNSLENDFQEFPGIMLSIITNLIVTTDGGKLLKDVLFLRKISCQPDCVKRDPQK